MSTKTKVKRSPIEKLKTRAKAKAKTKRKIKTYEVRVICLNCGHAATINILQGRSVAIHIRTILCSNCKNNGTYRRRLITTVVP